MISSLNNYQLKIKAKVCFQSFRKGSPKASLFEIPKDYKEEIMMTDFSTNENTSTTPSENKAT